MNRSTRLPTASLITASLITAMGGALVLVWWSWHALDPGMLLLGSRLC